MSGELTRMRAAAMTDTSAAVGLLGKNGRPLKFTPERIQQIRNLVERGNSREEIAEMLDVTVNSLQVTCSRLGLSLRRVRLQNGVRQNALQPDQAASTPPTISSNTVEPTNDAKSTNDMPASLALVFSYRGQQKVTEMPVTAEDLMHFMFASVFREQSFGNLIAEFVRKEIESERR
jgi:hypothetical protein